VDVASGVQGIALHFQERPRKFSSPLWISTNEDALEMAAGDIDGDGDVDLAYSTFEIRGLLVVRFQTDQKTFPQRDLVLSPGDEGTASYLRMRDLDADGDLDLVGRTSSQIAIFLQESPGKFSPTPLLLGSALTTSFPSDLDITDFDRNGLLDLVSLHEVSPLGVNLAVFSQLGPGLFSSPLTWKLPGLGLPWDLVLEDIDGDGDPDLVIGDYGEDRIVISYGNR